MYQRKVYIESETMRKAEENTRSTATAAHEAIKSGSSEEIKAAIRAHLDALQAHRAFIRANYNL